MSATDSDSVAQTQIRAFVDRILRLKSEVKDINGDIREVYAEAKGNGFDKTVLGKLVSYVEKRAAGAADLQEAEALFDLYLSAYDGASHTHAREDDSYQFPADGVTISNTSENAPEHDADGVIIEPEAAMLPQTDPVGPGSVSAEQASVESSATPFEPVIAPPITAAAGGDSARTRAAVPAEPTNVTQLHRFNEATHFANSKGLPRLHGCTKPEACAGSHRALCHLCIKPVAVGGAA